MTETLHFNVLSLSFVVKFDLNAGELSEPMAWTLTKINKHAQNSLSRIHVATNAGVSKFYIPGSP